MNAPIRHQSHILEAKSKKYFQNCLPDEWVTNEPDSDYGIDFQVEIAVNNQMTGLNFSVQLKSTKSSGNTSSISVQVNRSTISYYYMRLEPVMLVIFDAEDTEAYWSWVHDLNLDLTKPNKTFTITIQKEQRISSVDWDEVKDFVQLMFSKRTLSDCINLESLPSTQLAAWRAYHSCSYEHAIVLFKAFQKENIDATVLQALAWSYYMTYNYNDALLTINRVIDKQANNYALQIKACVLTEFGIRTNNRGMVLSGKAIFEKFITGKSDALHLYNYANALGALGENAKALEIYNLSLQKNPNSAECWKNLGSIYWRMNLHDKELECYDNALAINPRLEQALFSKGVTLSKTFGRHKEALTLLKIIIENEDSLLKNFPQGYFWIAYVYEHNEKIAESLHWVNKGLDLLPTDITLLNFKSNLLAKHCFEIPELQEEANAFFKYRIDLNNDPLSIYHYIKLHGLNEQDAFFFIKEKFPTVVELSLDNLYELGFTLDDLKESLFNIRLYVEFRKTYPSNRYLNHVINPHFSVEMKFWHGLEIIGLISFNKSIKSDMDDVTIIDGFECCRVLGDALPRLLKFLIPSQKFSTEESMEIVVLVIKEYTAIAYRELGAQVGFLTGTLSLEKVDSDIFITEEWTSSFMKGLYTVLVDVLNLDQQDNVSVNE